LEIGGRHVDENNSASSECFSSYGSTGSFSGDETFTSRYGD
jgi:hypothetical protein